MYDVDAVYGGQHPPFRSWLEVTTEKGDLQRWLRNRLPQLQLAQQKEQPTSVLDIGCGWGHMGLRLHKELRGLGLTDIRYTGIDPSGDQIAAFAKIVEARRIAGITLENADAMRFLANERARYDLVFASHALYYVASLSQTLQAMLRTGRELIIVHHGARGINTIHEEFPRLVGAGPNVISTDDHVHHALSAAMRNDTRTLSRYRFASTVDVSACVDPESERGRNLLAFFLERRFEEIAREDVADVRRFIQRVYEPAGYRMTHDVGVLVVS